MNQRLLKRGDGKPLSVLSGSGVFQGYASLFHHRDPSGDIVMPGAFADSLKRRRPADIRMLFQHDPAEPVGTWIDMTETPRGLFVRGRLDRNVQRGRELISLLETGGLDGLSIGFRTTLARHDRVNKARRLIAVDLLEISLVTFPMLDGARVTRTKAALWALAQSFFGKGPNTIQHGAN
ncbi:MAG: HK97 family phage prohead protease [Proteobacteria bacterium]|nr:HK97 family phage prohead protease [Pseudomonadota bacterium]